MGTGATPTYLTDGYTGMVLNVATTVTSGAVNTANPTVSPAAGGTHHSLVHLFQVPGKSPGVRAHGEGTVSNGFIDTCFYNSTTTAITAFRLFTGPGVTFTSGAIRLYKKERV